MCILFFAQFTAIFLDKKEVAMDTLNTVTLEVSFLTTIVVIYLLLC